MPDAYESASLRNGQIVTFYSFKGGTGRTMALANVAWILAANGKRVLVADWDLESPGLHRFLQPFLGADISEKSGIIDFIRKYEWAAVRLMSSIGEGVRKGSGDNVTNELTRLISDNTKVHDYAVRVKWEYPEAGSLSYLSPGRQNRDYESTLSALDWDTFYDRLNGAQFFDALRVDLKRNYDYVLIDSRTGLSDIASICTLQLPDVLLDCFTLSTQGIEGAANVARMVEMGSARDIRVLPVPMRIDPAEQEKVEAGRAYARRLFAGLPAGMSDAARRDYWAAVEVPYRAYYAYEENLAIFSDAPGTPTSLLASFERITEHITNGTITRLPPMDEAQRQRTRAKFARRLPSSIRNVILDFSPEDQLWAEWIASVIVASGIGVRNRSAGDTHESGIEEDDTSRVVAIMTQSYIEDINETVDSDRPDLVVCIAGNDLPRQFKDVPAVFISGLPEMRAAEAVLDRIDGQRMVGPAALNVRFPGTERTQVLNVPGRNVNFTGRDQDLRDLRSELLAHGAAAILPLTLQGLGGVGKTQVALEYAHRFKADYDVIWWINCGQSQYIDASLGDLGKRLREVFGANLPEDGSVTEVTREVLRLLSAGKAVNRWLLIYDNADDIEEVQPLLPLGHGHVLITSRNGAWGGRGLSLPVDVFTRAESIKVLSRRIPSITEAEADQVAEVLGDLPLAVATAGAWLAETGFSVPRYLEQLEQQPTRTLAQSRLTGDVQPIRNTWDISLDRLRDTSPAGARLFDLCAVMAPDIGLDLLYSPAMAAVLMPFDSALSEPMIIGRVVQEINRLALINLDTMAHQIQVHRLVQAVVRDRMSDDELTAARNDVHRVLAAARPTGDIDDPVTWPRYQLIWPHLASSDAMRSTQESVRQLLIDQVRYLRQRGELERGRRQAAQIEKVWEGMLTVTPDPLIAASLQNQLFRLRFSMASIARDLAEFGESLALDKAVLNGQRELLGEEHPYTLMTASGLAADFRALGQYERALEIDRGTYVSWTRQYGDDHPGTLSAAHNLAVSLRLTGDYESAVAQDRLTLRRRIATLGPSHPRTLDSGSAVARDLLAAGRYAEAADQMTIIWTQCREALGDDDRLTLSARLVLGMALRSAGHPDQAAEHFTEARKGLTRGFGSDSTDALACRLSQAVNLLGPRWTTEARTEAEAVFVIYQARLGTDHPNSLICKVDIAAAMYLQEDYESALVMAQSAAIGLEATLGANHPYTLVAKTGVATALAGQGNVADAEEIEKHTAAELARALGGRHPDTLRCRANMVLTRQAQSVEGVYVERQVMIEELTAALGSAHPDVRTFISGDRLISVIEPQPF